MRLLPARRVPATSAYVYRDAYRRIAGWLRKRLPRLDMHTIVLLLLPGWKISGDGISLPKAARTHVVPLIHDLHVRVVHATTGELLRELTINLLNPHPQVQLSPMSSRHRMVDLIGRYSKQTEQVKQVRKLLRLGRRTGSERADAPVTTPYKLSIRLSADEQTAIIRQYQAGATGRELAEHYDLARSTVIQLLKDHGVTVRHARVSSDEIALAVELYRQGLRQIDIARQLGRDKSLIWHLLNRAGALRDVNA